MRKIRHKPIDKHDDLRTRLRLCPDTLKTWRHDRLWLADLGENQARKLRLYPHRDRKVDAVPDLRIWTLTGAFFREISQIRAKTASLAGFARKAPKRAMKSRKTAHRCTRILTLILLAGLLAGCATRTRHLRNANERAEQTWKLVRTEPDKPNKRYFPTELASNYPASWRTGSWINLRQGSFFIPDGGTRKRTKQALLDEIHALSKIENAPTPGRVLREATLTVLYDPVAEIAFYSNPDNRPVRPRKPSSDSDSDSSSICDDDSFPTTTSESDSKRCKNKDRDRDREKCKDDKDRG